MASRRTLVVTADQQHELPTHRDHDPRPYVRERCAAVLKIAAGHAPYWVARHGLLQVRAPATVDGWRAQYQAAGLAGVLAHPQGGNRRRWLRLRPAGGAGGALAAAAGRGRPSGGGCHGE